MRLQWRHRLTWIAVVVLLSAGGCSHPTEPRVHLPSPRNAIDSALVGIAERNGYPAIAGAVIWEDSMHVSAIGYRKLGDTAQVTLADRFHLGSVTKPMVATMLATLVEHGDLAWTTTAASVFPELADTIHPFLTGVTLQQLVAHRAGIHSYDRPTQFPALDAYTGTEVQQRVKFTTDVLHEAPVVTVGSYHYSNAGYSIAAAMAERVTGQTWEALMQTRLFQPLGIQGEFGWPAKLETDQPWGHWIVNGQLVPQDPNGDYALPIVLDPAGDVNMTIDNFAHFVQVHLRGLLGTDSVLTAATFQYLHSGTAPYALGWGIGEVDGVASTFHDGSAGSFGAAVLVQPTRRVAVVVLANAAPEDELNSLRDAELALLRLR